MSEVSKKRVELRLALDFYERVQAAADSAGVSVPAWIMFATSAYLRKWSPPKENPALYEKCSMCGKRHDKSEHTSD